MKLWNYIIIFITMILIIEFSGLHTGLGGTLKTFGITINPTTSELEEADIQNSSLFLRIFQTNVGILAALLATGVGAIIVGFFAKSYDPSLILLPLIVFIGGLFASTGLALINFIPENETWLKALIGTIFLPLIAGYVWSCVEFFRGVN